MKAASDFVYIKKSIKLSLSNETEEIKEEQWEIESDELNQNFDSDAPDNEAQEESKVQKEKKTYGFSLLPSDPGELMNELLQNARRTNFQPQRVLKMPEHKPIDIKTAEARRKEIEAKFRQIQKDKKKHKQTTTKEQEPTPKEESKKGKLERIQRKGRTFKIEVDTNVMAIDLKTLQDEAPVASGDPVFCSNCSVVLNTFSKIVNVEGSGTQIWRCEFCDHKNEVNLEIEEIPTKEVINYLLESKQTDDVNEEEKNTSTSGIIFCVDTSGSMGINKDKLKKTSEGYKITAGALINTKLSIIKRAIKHQICAMKSLENKVGIITFTDSVNLIGDGTQDIQIIEDKESLNNFDTMLEIGQQFSQTHMNGKIMDCYTGLTNIIRQIKGKGRTALGPAALVSIAAASKLGSGSKVIICTDGLSNIGIGNLSDLAKGRVSQEEIDEFYQKIASLANEHGVTVDLLSMKGEECDLETLVTLTDKTGGDVDIINPEDLSGKLGLLISKKSIATKVKVKIHLHRAFEFKNENGLHMNIDKTLLIKNLGSINEDTEITFEYCVKDLSALKKIDDFNIYSLGSVPFQAVIEYTNLKGMKCIRVISKSLKITDNIEKALKDAKIDILATNAAQQVSKIARSGKFREAQAYSMNQKKLISSQAKSDTQKKVYSTWKSSMNAIYRDIHNQNNLEELAEKVSDTKERMLEKSKEILMNKSKRGYASKANDMFMNSMNRGMKFNSRKFV